MIAIVGAGLTGLALALELRRRGLDHVVLEAADRAGGVIRSEHVDGRVLDMGPQRVRMTAALARLVAELGLEPDVVRAPPGLPLYVYAEGTLRRVPFTPREFLATDLLSTGAKLRLLLEPLTRAPRDEERVSDALARKLGRQVYERLVGPLYGGLYASDPAHMIVGFSLRHTLRDLGIRRSLLLPVFQRRGSIVAPGAFSFVGGLQTLTDSLHAEAGDAVRLGARVKSLVRRDGRWELELEGDRAEAQTVVLTCDAPAAAALLERAAPDIAIRLSGLAYNPLAIVHLYAPDVGLAGLGYQVALGEDLATRGVTSNEDLFDREGVHTAFLGGAARPEVVGESDEWLGEIAALEFRQVTGRDPRPLRVTRVRMPAWDATWAALAGLEAPPGIVFAANWESRPGIAGRLARAKAVAQEVEQVSA